MAVPNFQDFLLPLLVAIQDGLEHRIADLYDRLARTLEVSDEDRAELLTSGKQTRFENRVGWAKTYLAKAKLVDSPGRGICVITDRGLDVLRQNPKKLDIAYLRQFPEFIEFQQAAQVPDAPLIPDRLEVSPEEVLDNAYRQLTAQLAHDILEIIMASPPSVFERLVVELLLKMGYGGKEQIGRAVGRPGDGGIDGIINQDRLGLDVVYIQAKRWAGPVGRPEVQAFTGSLEGM